LHPLPLPPRILPDSGPPIPALPLIAWIRDHDESLIFVALYIGLAVVLSVFVSLFWLLFVAAAHFALEWARHVILRGEHGWEVPVNALWEVKLDVGLVLVALALALYMEVILGVLGLQSAARAGAAVRAGGKMGPRILGWDKAIRGFLLTVDDLANVVRAIFMRRGRRKPDPLLASAAAEAIARTGVGETRLALGVGIGASSGESDSGVTTDPGQAPVLGGGGIPADGPTALWREPWSRGDRFALALVVASALLIVVTPLLTDHTAASAVKLLAEELHPFPPRD